MRIPICWAVALVLLASSAAPAQDGLRSASLPERTPQNPIPPAPEDIYRVPPAHWTRLPHRPGVPTYPIYGYGPYLAPEPPRDADRFDRRGRVGYLHFEMQPASAQVYVDGYYMGSVEDFRRLIPGRSLEAGGHRVDIRAPGYEARTFDVMIPPNETVSYRTDLRRDEPAVAARAGLPPARPKTFYVIPGCYAGDKPPTARLPRGCDRSKLRAVPPHPTAGVQR